MKYEKTQPIAGAWVKGSEVTPGTRGKLVSETTHVQSQFVDEKTGEKKYQDVAKVLFSGDTEAKNISINRASLFGLIDAFGEESSDWMNHILTVETEKVLVGGRRVTAVYLVPENYQKIDDENGYTVIVKKGSTAAAAQDAIPF